MTFVRLVCKLPKQPPPGPGGIVINLLPTGSDAEVFLVDSATGKETPIDGVTSFECTVAMGVVTGATIRVQGVALDVYAESTKDERDELEAANRVLMHTKGVLEGQLAKLRGELGYERYEAITR